MLGKQITAGQLMNHNGITMHLVTVHSLWFLIWALRLTYTDRHPTASVTNNLPRDRYPACHSKCIKLSQTSSPYSTDICIKLNT